MHGINFGGCQFSEPALLPTTATAFEELFPQSGLYAILVYDPACRPRPFKALYFGESENINTRANATHEKYSAWRVEAGTFMDLYRAICPLPGSSKFQRQQIESALIVNYKPACNERLSCDLRQLHLR